MASFETSQSWQPKRQRADNGDSARSLQYDDYTVGWISALPLEMTAAQAMLDQRHEPLHQHPQDSNCYEFGSINGHNVVIACLPKAQYGNNNAAIVANNMNRTFPHLQYRVLVGISGGAPGPVDVRLGDVVVSTYAIQYDLGKAMPNNQFQHIAEAIRPPQALLTAVSKVEARHNGGQVQMLEVLSDATARMPHYGHPKLEDCLFLSEFTHTSSGANCDSCDRSQLVLREIRHNANPVIHYGRVASGDQVIKDAPTRDSLSKRINSICFEMEAAGVMDCFSCLIIRGICDYSDSHKNKGWQEYAALVAAAYAKELLMSIPPQVLQHSKRRKAQHPTTPEHISPEVDECLRAMFVTDSSLDREGILDAKGDICEGTCEWILSTDEFKAWEKDPPHLLWASAPPGMGKTFMSIYLSKHLEAAKKGSKAATIFFFCDNKVETRNTARLFQENSFGTLWKVFEDMISQSDSRTIYCVIDALDECEASSLSLLLRKFERLSRRQPDSSPKMKLICLSRRYPQNIPEALLQFIKMELDTMIAKEEDISRFISVQVQELAQKKQLSSKMRSMLQETFLQKSEGTFLWVSYMSHDLQKQGLLDFEASLDMLPAGLDAVYERILQSIDFEKGKLIHDLLYWILVATRPLTVGELCEAVSMKPTRLLTREEVCIELIKSCGHLLQTTDKHIQNSVQRTVTFLHQSAKDYILKFDLPFGSQIPKLIPTQLHEHAIIVLLKYLEQMNSRQVKINKTVDDIANDWPLANYAVNEWHLHFKQLEDITQVMQQGLSFFRNDSQVRHMWQYLYRLNGKGTIPLLHLSAFLGLDSLVEWYLRHDGAHNVETDWGGGARTALVIACEHCRENIVSLLLEAGANPVAEKYLESALNTAISYCNRRILHLMARREPCREVFIENEARQDGSLVYVAAEFGNKDACRFLIEDLGWDLNWKYGTVGSSALMWALSSGNFELISYFIKEWHVSIKNESDTLKTACSSLASASDFEKIIRLLVDHYSLDLNATDVEGHNALCFTIANYESQFSSLYTTRTLLQFGCSPDQPDCLGRTTMYCHSVTVITASTKWI
ncbi:heterokaryon incompatibility protein het-E-1 [Fusarium napiforme]|uniref:Heterokaryon incompatibility protein het-E-1 n=1 Tax=Fusarium napiforme TaxID=42672 RepID=A0A8H5NHX2_9HYPO|nr:heterokaryon incompatibility protein het-E-1 [Fusarium napiforme]